MPPLQPQPSGVPWPTQKWPESELGPDVDRERVAHAVDRVFAAPHVEATGETHALVVVHRGALVLERYGSDYGPDVPLVSWSMAKSFTHALVGILVREGRLEVQAPAAVPAWQGAGDPRGRITLEHLLRMCDGLDFAEDYEVPERSHVIEMLFGSGKDDVAGYAAARPLAHRPGTWWSYSSGTSNIVAGILGRTVGGGRDGMLGFMRRELFDPIGMRRAEPRFDASGTFIGSSFVFATARDFARFGLLYLRGGVWEGAALLPGGWVDHARTVTPQSSGWYGAHFWLALDGSGIFHASGYRGQYIVIDPRRDLVVVRLGGSVPEQRAHVMTFLADLVRAFPLLDPPRG
ncbi:MAG: serine hydrolase [Deltaproteobacteria bacterium]|nr:MAG: serine hydrolase [Deltaproteobacteria bacterium]